MPYSTHTKRLTPPPRARLLTAVALLSGALMAGCGGSAGSATGGASTSASKASAVESGLAFTRCIRSHGVPNFPDPTLDSEGRPFFNVSGAGISHQYTHSPQFASKDAECERLVGGSAGVPVPLG